MFRTALLVFSGNAAASFLLLIRNILIARLISVEDYAIGATFLIAVATVEMLSTIGLQQQIVQSDRGNDPHFQAALQGFNLLRGLLAGVTLFVLAGPIADFLKVPEAAWAYRLLALVPVLHSLVHFDIYRLNRDMVFLPMVLSVMLSPLISLLAVWPLERLFGDYRIVVYAILIQQAVLVLVSHRVARRAWRIAFDRHIITWSLKFGWPLLLNSVILFAVFYGDRLIVAREFSKEALGIFSIGVTLTLTPVLLVGKSLQNLLLPQFAKLREIGNRDKFLKLSIVLFELTHLSVAALVLIILFFGGFVVDFLLGEKYMPLVPYLVWLSVLHGAHLLKYAPGIIALSIGRTSNSMIANVFRLPALGFAWWAAAISGDLFHVIWIATLGELAGYVMGMMHLGSHVRLAWRRLILMHVLHAVFLAVVAWYILIAGGGETAGLPDLGAMGVLILPFLALVLSMQGLLRGLISRMH